MQVCTFDYTKLDGKTSRRVLVPLVKPGAAYEGIDVTEASTEDQALFITELEVAKQAYLQKIAELERKYDLQHCYRKFLEDRMSNFKLELI